MKQISKSMSRLLSLLIVATMIIGMLPVTAFAAEGDVTYTKVTSNSDIEANGTYLIVAHYEGDYLALTNDANAKTTEVDVTGNTASLKTESDAAKIEWTVTAKNGRWLFQNGGKTLNRLGDNDNRIAIGDLPGSGTTRYEMGYKDTDNNKNLDALANETSSSGDMYLRYGSFTPQNGPEKNQTKVQFHFVFNQSNPTWNVSLYKKTTDGEEGPGEGPGGPGEDTTGTGHNIGFTSDVHDKTDNFTTWFTTVQSALTPDLELMAFGGDYASAYSGRRDTIIENLEGTLTASGVTAGFTFGNHDYEDYPLNSSIKRNVVADESDAYDVYLWGASSGDGEGSFTDIDTLEAYLKNENTDKNEPIFIVSHYPLHYIESRTIENAKAVIDLLNGYPNVIFIWGHNHSQNGSWWGSAVEENYGTIKVDGEFIEYAEDESTEINFTYANAGAMNGSQSPYYGLVANISADSKTVTLTYYSISGVTNIKTGDPEDVRQTMEIEMVPYVPAPDGSGDDDGGTTPTPPSQGETTDEVTISKVKPYPEITKVINVGDELVVTLKNPSEADKQLSAKNFSGDSSIVSISPNSFAINAIKNNVYGTKVVTITGLKAGTVSFEISGHNTQAMGGSAGSVYGVVINLTVNEVHQHNRVWNEGQAATCGDDGWNGYWECSDEDCETYFDTTGAVIEDLDAWKDGDGKIPATGQHTDAANDGDHDCDVCRAENVSDHTGGTATCTTPKTCSECGEEYGSVDANNHKDANQDHVCDYGCNVPQGTHADGNDANHTCDYCEKAVEGETCFDAANDNDHNCDECGAPVGSCADNNKDHQCDNGCNEPQGTHADGDDKNHTCDYCEGAVEGETCSDAENDNDHKCDECGAPVGGCADNNKDHQCDNGCNEPQGTHADGDDKNHTCDYCEGPVEGETCFDAANDNDHNCDECGEPLSECADNNNDHKCDVCGGELGQCADEEGDEDHKCDVCGKDNVTQHTGGTATCTTPKTCSECRQSYGEIDANAHAYPDEWTPADDGEKHEKVCANNKQHVKQEDHKWGAENNGIKTCTECGAEKEIKVECHEHSNKCYMMGWWWPICGKNEVPHIWEDATCTTPKTCSRCEKTDGTALGHNMVIDNAVPATCEGTGLTEGSHCSRCDEATVDQVIVPALGHDYVGVVTTPATCTKPGVKTFTCQNDSSHTYTRPVDATGHDWQKVNKKNPTCTEPGCDEHYKCKKCDMLSKKNRFGQYYEVSKETVIKPVLGHDWNNGFVTTKPGCTTEGVKTFKCERWGCGATKTDPIPATGHNWGEWFDNAFGNNHMRVCKNDKNHTETKAHEWSDWKVTKEPTCTKKGEETRVCGVCKRSEKRDVKALDHDYTSVVTAPTCTEWGYTTYTCKRGDHTFKWDYVKPLGHTEVIDAAAIATCTKPGKTMGKHCSVCKEVLVEQEEVAALGHSYEAVVTAPTCTEDGYTTYTCGACKDTYTADVVPALGHAYPETWTDAKDGVNHKKVCANDPTHVLTEAHSMNAWSRSKEPTYTTEGEDRRDCVVDNCEYFETRAVAKIPEPMSPVGPTIAKPMVKNLNTTDHVAYIIGYADGTVRPTANITRAQVATIYFRLMTDEARDEFWSTENPYLDVNAGDWFNTAVSTLHAAGVIVDVTDGNFRPNEPITRAELAVMAAQFYSGRAVKGNSSFEDVAEDYWAAKEIAIVEKAGWIEGYNGFYRPDDTITRAETMTIVNRMLQRAVEADDMLDDMVTFSDNLPSLWYYEAVQEATNSHTYKRTGAMVDEEEYRYEKWLKILEAPDWAAQEAAWQAANSN